MSESVILFDSKEKMLETLRNKNIVQIRYSGKTYNLVLLNKDVFVFETHCPHFDYPLSEAKINPNGFIICAWHNYQYNLETGEERESRTRDLLVSKARWNENDQLEVVL